MKRLIANADDFGFTPDVNAGIIEAHQRGILTATTLMANGDAFDDAVRLSRANPALDVGCHLVLVGGPSVARPSELLPPSAGRLAVRVALGRLDIYEELAGQVSKIISAGIQPTHLDTHKHTHLAPPVLRVVLRVSREFGIPWVRRPFDFPLQGGSGPAPWLQRAAGRAMPLLRRRFERVVLAGGCRMTDHFAGFQLTGRFRTQELVSLIHALPGGLTEFMCHPGRCRDQLRHARTRLKQSREHELEALTAKETKAAIAEAGVILTSYRTL